MLRVMSVVSDGSSIRRPSYLHGVLTIKCSNGAAFVESICHIDVAHIESFDSGLVSSKFSSDSYADAG